MKQTKECRNNPLWHLMIYNTIINNNHCKYDHLLNYAARHEGIMENGGTEIRAFLTSEADRSAWLPLPSGRFSTVYNVPVTD
jgi:hypothetical protein